MAVFSALLGLKKWLGVISGGRYNHHRLHYQCKAFHISLYVFPFLFLMASFMQSIQSVRLTYLHWPRKGGKTIFPSFDIWTKNHQKETLFPPKNDNASSKKTFLWHIRPWITYQKPFFLLQKIFKLFVFTGYSKNYAFFDFQVEILFNSILIKIVV